MTCILVVDDDKMSLELAHDVLELDGFEVITAESGKDGVAKAQNSRPDLILMDICMPDMSGLQAMCLLKDDEVIRHIPIAALTASAMKGDAGRLLAEGFDACLQKPIEPDTFADEVRALLNP